MLHCSVPEQKRLMPPISDEARYYLMFFVFFLSAAQFADAPDWSATSCELLEDYPSEEAMEKWVWCINSTIANYTLKNSELKTALCCTEDNSPSAIVTTVLSVIIPIILASVELSNAYEAKRIADIKETNKNKALYAATAE